MKTSLSPVRDICFVFNPAIANKVFPVPAVNALGRRLESAQHHAPHILTRGVITPQEAEKLFEM
jgi:hypothetical protein